TNRTVERKAGSNRTRKAQRGKRSGGCELCLCRTGAPQLSLRRIPDALEPVRVTGLGSRIAAVQRTSGDGGRSKSSDERSDSASSLLRQCLLYVGRPSGCPVAERTSPLRERSALFVRSLVSGQVLNVSRSAVTT